MGMENVFGNTCLSIPVDRKSLSFLDST